MTDTLARLEATIAARREAEPDGSYTAGLFAKGRPTMARKLGEEAVELIVASLAQDHAAITAESADLIFHLLVLLADAGIEWREVLAELERREGTSGLVEKAGRPVD
ncbi:phosphoribosyl-ATP pyrophosphohydrolase [Sphingomonas vulcanisoli]|uniref:Phosphoribosyl-ATP pyrophosphatase n=1 Tax=Sphingomonas vulcanisoli TaxID=1658060 RepID=A0ABX0TRK7_9SPHN|nr:phosphoribosyl-ATP diphosphatase [Sphingomonas vulcanisoli]NIJ08167.1 phosphoribosyl-ATP pyrophosphohydrolase [Sphingomonas vulcanisoli]